MTGREGDMTIRQARQPRRPRPQPMPDFRRLLKYCPAIGRGKSTIVAAGGKVVHTSEKRTLTRWNNVDAARRAERQRRLISRSEETLTQMALSLRVAEETLANNKRDLSKVNKELGQSGRSVMRLDHLRAWIEAHMPSILAVAVKDHFLRVRFCAAAMRGAGRRAGSPTRYLIPAIWATIDLNTGVVASAVSDSLPDGALHPHARMDSGAVCGGRAINVPDRQPVQLDDVKKVLAEVETWRMHYGDDTFEHPQGLAGRTWHAVKREIIGLAPVQGTTGMMYSDVNALLRAEPWDGSRSNNWCANHDMSFDDCGCCRVCGFTDGCGCGRCQICSGNPDDCDCCTWCGQSDAVWAYRGSANEHQLCSSCGYCRVCNHTHSDADRQGGRWGRAISFLTETDIARVNVLATLEYGTRAVQPDNYMVGCDCDGCRRHTEFINSQ